MLTCSRTRLPRTSTGLEENRTTEQEIQASVAKPIPPANPDKAAVRAQLDSPHR